MNVTKQTPERTDTGRRAEGTAPCESDGLADASASMRERPRAHDAERPGERAGDDPRGRPAGSAGRWSVGGARRPLAPPERPRDGEGDGLDDAGKLLGSFTACVP